MAMTAISRMPSAQPIEAALVRRRSSFQTTGTPPKVSPMNRLYMIQRSSTTRPLIKPARVTMANAPAPQIEARMSSELRRNCRRVTSAMPWMNCG